MARLEKRNLVNGRTIRFTNFIDEESFEFETEASALMSGAAIEQTLAYVKHLKRKFFVFQMRAPDGTPAMQACVFVGQPKWLKGFALASVPNLHSAINEEEEEFGLKLLRELCGAIPSLMTLRLQPQRYEVKDLFGFETRATRQAFQKSSPIGPTRTLLLDLGTSSDELYARLPTKTRSKLRHAGRELVELRPITESSFIDRCRVATNASRARSGSNETSYDFQTAFAIATDNPDQGKIIGLFHSEEPEQPLAYVIGLRNGSRCEYSSAGAFGDSRLRAMPFNYFLFWELAEWARSVGCTHMDMGGITEGGDQDPLRGIAQFKRSIANHELEVGREMVSVLRPIRYSIYRLLKKIQAIDFSIQPMSRNYD